MRTLSVAPLALAAGLAMPAATQTLLDVGALCEINGAEILSADGTETGEVEDLLVDAGKTATSARP